LDTSGWPDSVEPLLATFDDTRRALWSTDRGVHDQYLGCLDALIAHCVSDPAKRASHTLNFLRRQFHPLLCRHDGADAAPWGGGSESAATTESGSDCPAEHLASLTRAAAALETQADLRTSALWASEKIPIVVDLGWNAVGPDDVIGLAALNMLTRGVRDQDKFLKEVLPTYAVKPKQEKPGGDGFVDDGREISEYARKLLRECAGNRDYCGRRSKPSASG
jgi:hypothetical protein